MTDSLTFVHFSDTHIVRPGVRLRNVDTIETLTRVVETVNRLDPQPAFVVIGGDLVSPDDAPKPASSPCVIMRLPMRSFTAWSAD